MSIDLADLDTPCLLLEEERMDRSAAAMRARLARLGVRARPHLKTAKSIDVARRVMETPEGPGTVSTLKEAEYFAAHGVRDLLYAVGIAPRKLARVRRIRADGCDLSVVVDSVEAARIVADHARASGDRQPVLVEIDADGKRAGLAPDDPSVVEVARVLEAGGAAVRGVMTHMGGSYAARGVPAMEAAAEAERAAALHAAAALRAAGFACPVVSVGSTPTARYAKDLSGVTEVRAGVYVFEDLVMAGLGVCAVDDIALSVLATVIGRQEARGWILVDAGFLALSRDRGTAAQEVDQGYGVVCDEAGRPYPDLIVVQANQEHGICAIRPGAAARLPDLAIGDRVRILPNHACATAAAYDLYHVVEGGQVKARWPRVNGW
jgi:D-serine deaminase-like pyridoxal phosphate-dependent protein